MSGAFFNTTGAQQWGEKPLGCDECNRAPDAVKPWPIFTVDFHGVECCAKCLTPMAAGRAPRVPDGGLIR